MWTRLFALTLLLLAPMARSIVTTRSALCPRNCECIVTGAQPDDSINYDTSNHEMSHHNTNYDTNNGNVKNNRNNVNKNQDQSNDGNIYNSNDKIQKKPKKINSIYNLKDRMEMFNKNDETNLSNDRNNDSKKNNNYNRNNYDRNSYEKSSNKSYAVHCTDVPKLDFFPKNSRVFLASGIKSGSTSRLVFDLENSENVALRELALVNCSLKSFNATLSRLSKSEVTEVAFRLNLSDNKISETHNLRIPDAGRNLAVLDLSRNSLTRIRSEAFIEYKQLLRLFLRGNSIERIETNGFAGLDRLESLDLAENRLSTLAEDTFVPLCYLKSLNLSGNRLGVLGEQWFDNLGNLKQLDVTQLKAETSRSEDVELSLVLGSVQRLETIDASRIGLERVPSALTRSVRSLNLSGNRLTIIRGGDLDSYPLLRVLDLSYNFITVVENDALGRLEVLERLDLSGNRLRELPQSLPCSLRRLVMRGNFITSVNRRDLEGLSKLESFLLDDNDLAEIEEGSMSQLSLLRELDISDNPIKQLPADTFGGPANLEDLRMSRLESLHWENEKDADMAFPVPAPERLVTLDLSGSPVLAAQLFADEAALSACKSLRSLDVSETNLTELRSDLPYLLPQLKYLGLSGNPWNCTEDNRVNWLARWIQEHEEIGLPGECKFINGTRIRLNELPVPKYESKTTTSFFEEFEGSMSLENFQEERRISTALGAHPGIFILAAATICTLVLALSILMSRRRVPTIEERLERYEQRRPIITELW